MAYHRIHSASGFIIREAFDDADDRDKIARTNWSVSHICFIAADVSSKDTAETSSNSNSLYRHCVRLTNYHNPYDSVLKLSSVKRIGLDFGILLDTILPFLRRYYDSAPDA